MGRDFREVAKDITSALNLGEDEGKIKALAESFEDAANRSFGRNNDLQTKLIHSLIKSVLSRSRSLRGGMSFFYRYM